MRSLWKITSAVIQLSLLWPASSSMPPRRYVKSGGFMHMGGTLEISPPKNEGIEILTGKWNADDTDVATYVDQQRVVCQQSRMDGLAHQRAKGKGLLLDAAHLGTSACGELDQAPWHRAGRWQMLLWFGQRSTKQSFHGPWLQLPLEILETLAHSNYLSPRPRLTEPAVLYDLLKIRRLVDEASNLAVRAQNGIASSAMRDNDNGMLGGGALGLGARHGGNAKLSAERKYRMRELATQKLSQAYRLDEIAASVATMQSASALDNVASLVLQRQPSGSDATYVHFFHEKIPSRMMADYTPLDCLNHVISCEPAHAAPYRTRALTRIFKDDHVGAARDLTEALNLARLEASKHTAGKDQLVTMQAAQEDAERRKVWTKDWMQENRVADDDQPKSIESQIYFQRGSQYLALACQCVQSALESFRRAQELEGLSRRAAQQSSEQRPRPVNDDARQEAYRRGLEARDLLRRYAKRALRDFTSFCALLDYAHAPVHRTLGDPFRRTDVEEGLKGRIPEPTSSQALVQSSNNGQESWGNGCGLTTPSINSAADLLSASPPSDLPPFPSDPNQQYHEMVTYHPLLAETLHSLLLAHCLLQTPPTTMNRVATNVARITRLADGYPFFLSARSPARADWTEVIRRSNNWITLNGNWDNLCRPLRTSNATASPSTATFAARQTQKTSALIPANTGKGRANGNLGLSSSGDPETAKQKRDRIHKEAVMDALGDDRVVDDNTFQRAVEARERRAWRDEGNDHDTDDHLCKEAGRLAIGTSSSSVPLTSPLSEEESGASGSSSVTSPSTPVARDEEYLIGTERASLVARWVIEAPTTVTSSGGGSKKPRRKKPKRPQNAPSADADVEELNA
ncbi:hypothetical protein FH972_022135 [Carpinus fangiana]|uniref:Uncharacterized protein n=1 Tax=Carpinus fangiana TaxID=176857 RepID=A0A5N6KTK1_9ROSI|nr:hypothetical protein FH972_022135 [Carpinus fangiana]